MYFYEPSHKQKQDDQLEHTYSSYVSIWDVALKTCQSRWTIGKSGERGSGISVLAEWHDDDDRGEKWKILFRMYEHLIKVLENCIFSCLYLLVFHMESGEEILQKPEHNLIPGSCESKDFLYIIIFYFRNAFLGLNCWWDCCNMKHTIIC